MLTGVINRRVGVRAPVRSEVKIGFRDTSSEAITLAIATNLSAGGMQFTLPAQPRLLNIGEKISFIFQLPDYGEIAVQSEVRYRTVHQGSSGFEAHCGVKFLDLSLDSWNSIRQYCELNHVAQFEEDNVHNSSSHTNNPLAALLKATIEFEDGLTIHGVIEDLSFGGVRVNLGQPLPINSHISLNILYEKNILKLKGYCIWCAPEKLTPQQFLAGIFFPGLNQEQFDQLKLLVNRKN